MTYVQAMERSRRHHLESLQMGDNLANMFANLQLWSNKNIESKKRLLRVFCKSLRTEKFFFTRNGTRKTRNFG